MIKLERERFNFTSSFQDLILACWIKKPSSFLKYGSILDPKYFSGTLSMLTAKAINDHMLSHNKSPSWEVLGQRVEEEAELVNQDKEESHEYVKKLRRLDTSDSDYVASKVIEFVREKATIEAIKKSIKAIQEGKKNKKGKGNVNIVKLFEDALKVGQNMEDLGYLFHRDYSDVVNKVTRSDYGVKTGYPLLDKIWKNGWAPGWLIVPLAPPKRFKSLTCINLALNMVGPSIRADVIYYPCEISQELALVRAMCNIARQSTDYMYQNPEKFKEQFRKNMSEYMYGKLLIKGFGAKQATIMDIRNHAKTVISHHGIKPKAIFIDYAETVKPMDTDQSEHQQSASVYTDAKELGKELNCSVIMPDRCNKETVGHQVPSMASFQGAFQKAGIVDIAFGICSTDAEYLNNVVRFFNFLNRHGQAYQHIRGKVDPENMSIEFTEEIAYEPDEDPKARGKTNRSIPKELTE